MQTKEKTTMSKQLSDPCAVRTLAAALALAALAGCAANRAPTMAPPAQPSSSVAEADRKLADAARTRAQAEAAFAASEQLCHAKFFVNNCLDEARDKRRLAVSGLRAVEVEAERYKRKAEVDQRDRELAEAEKQFKEEEARMAGEPPPAPREVPPPPAPRPAAIIGRAAAHADKLKRQHAAEQAGAAKRAAKVEAHEKRKRDSERRKKEIEEKKKKALEASEGR
jgi:colicin import membrane protein